MTNAEPLPWLLLIPQLPAKPAYLRVKVWRRLQAIGAAALKNAVHALPNQPDTRILFEELHREITDNGGEALIFDARLAGGMADADLCAIFDAARDADYEELAREGRSLAEAEYVPTGEVRRLRKRLDEIAGIDFFGAHGRQEAESAIGRAESRAGQHPDVTGQAAPELTSVELKGRTWVTRRHIHVDRIASAWLIRRFIDPEATFRFVDGKGYVPELGELRFDMVGAEFSHEDDRCSFETLVLRAELGGDRALVSIAEIIHDLDIGDGKFNRPETVGLGAMLSGVCASNDDDLERISRGGDALDQFYSYFTNRKGER